jgi:hypothetical protein
MLAGPLLSVNLALTMTVRTPDVSPYPAVCTHNRTHRRSDVQDQLARRYRAGPRPDHHHRNDHRGTDRDRRDARRGDREMARQAHRDPSTPLSQCR